MDEKTDTAQRGSDRMFELGGQDADRIFEEGLRDTGALEEAIGSGRGEYEIKWWWKYGQPAFIDQIRGGLHVSPENVGPVLERLLRLNSKTVQVTARVFPYGITNPDLFQVELDMQRSPRG